MLAETQAGIEVGKGIFVNENLLVAAIGVLGTAVAFLFRQINRTNERTEKEALRREQAYKEDRDKVEALFDKKTAEHYAEKEQLWGYIRSLEGLTCPAEHCPIRQKMLPAFRLLEEKKGKL